MTCLLENSFCISYTGFVNSSTADPISLRSPDKAYLIEPRIIAG
jgi:hypothetical protein